MGAPARGWRWRTPFWVWVCLCLAALVSSAHGQAVRETFADNPLASGRFAQRTEGTESSFAYNSATQNSTAVLDVDASPAYYLSSPFTPLTDAADASFSMRFRVERFDDQGRPTVFLGLVTDQHVGDFGDGLIMVLSATDGALAAHADLESFDQSYSGGAIPLQLGVEYLAMGRYLAASRQFALELFTGADFGTLAGFSIAALPPGQTISVDRLGLQNSGARDLDSASGSITVMVDDLFTPAVSPRRLNMTDAVVTEPDAGVTNVVVQVQLTPASSLPVSVSFATADGTAKAGLDYAAQSGTLTFAPGVTSAPVVVPIIGDLVHEASETFVINLSNATGAEIAKGSGTVTILDNDPRPLLAVDDVGTLEGDTGTRQLQFHVSLDPASGQAVTVNYATADGAATQGSDYVAQSGALTFVPGETNKVVTVEIKGDSQVEPDETFLLKLSNPINAGFVRTQGVATIFDDDGQRRLSIDDVTVTEGNAGLTPAVFTISMTRASTSMVTVDYTLVSGTATVGQDVVAASGKVTIQPGAMSATLPVSVVGDTAPESDETLFVQLSSPAGAEFARAVGQGLIRNDDAFPEINVDDARVAEGDSGTKILEFPVRLSFALAQPVTVNFVTADGTAVAPGDYAARSGTVTFAPGETRQTIGVTINGDTSSEADETLLVNLSGATLATIGRTQAVGTIGNDDAPPVITADDLTVLEGESGSTAATFTLRLSKPSGQPVSVSYSTADQTAIAGSDYVAGFGTVVWPPGATVQTVTLQIRGDTLFEPSETFLLRLANPVNAALARTEVLGTIQNDDAPPDASINDVAVTETPGGSIAVFTVTLSKPSTQAAVTVEYATTDDSATGALDYLPVSGVLVFPPGVTQATIRVPILDDLFPEGDEILLVELTGATNARLVGAEGWGTIHDNDAPPRLFIRDAQAPEGDSGTTSLVFNVELDRPSGSEVSAAFTARDGTATAASGDYVASSGLVRIPAGRTNATITVVVNGDNLIEPDEILAVELTQPLNAIEGRMRAAGMIRDDDTRRLSISDASVAEGPAGSTTNAVFTVTLSKPSPQTVTVRYATSDGTATSPKDYLAASGQLTFEPGVVSRDVAVAVVGDNEVEPDETFLVVLSDPANAVLEDGQGVGTIVDDEDELAVVPAGMTLDTEDCTPNNGAVDPGETVTVRLALKNVGTLTSSTVVATLSASPGVTPLNSPQNYGVLGPKSDPVARTFTFRADGQCGDTLQAVLQIQNGATNYGTAVYSFTLGTTVDGRPVCCQSADLAVTGAVDQSAVTVGRPLTYTLQVSNRGPKAATAVMLTNTWRAAVTIVSATASQGSCVVQGQTELCNLGTINPGGSANVQLVVTPQDVGPLIGVFYGRAAEHDPKLANNSATAAVVVNPPPGLSISNARVVEGAGGTTNAVFTVRLSPATGREVRVNYATLDGMARAGEDYVATQGTLIIQPGDTATNLFVSIIGDNKTEGDETFAMMLSNPVNAAMPAEQSAGIGTIIDDDLPTLSVDDARGAEPANGDSATADFVLRLSTTSPREVTVDYATTDGSARAPGDYLALSGRVTFPPGITRQTVSVPIVSDSQAEPEETFYLRLSSPVGTVPARSQATGVIADNAAPQISIGNAWVVEGRARTATNAVFTVTLSRPGTVAIQVDFTSGNGTASGGSDFVITSGTLTFAPGQVSATIPVQVNGDDTPEPDEKFYVRLSNPVNATIGLGQGEGTIIGDEYLPDLISGGAQLLVETCSPANQAIDPMEPVTVNLGLVNRGVGATTNLTASIVRTGQVTPLSNGQSYGVVLPNAAPVFRPFTFAIGGACGERQTLELELRDGGVFVGTVPFEFVLGKLQQDGQFVCCSNADLAVAGSSSSEAASLATPLAYSILVTNRGPSTATGVVLTNTFSASVRFISSTAPESVFAPQENQLLCNLGDMPAGTGRVITNVVTPGVLGTLANRVWVTSEVKDPLLTNNYTALVNLVGPPVGLSMEDASVLEGNADRAADLTVRLWPARSQAVTVDYVLSDGSARAGEDYVAKSGTLTFPAGSTTATLTATIKGDLVDEPDETLLITLRNPVNATIARGQATLTILDDDAPSLDITDTAVNVGTNAVAFAVLNLTLSSPSRDRISVDYVTANGTANAGTDYESQRGTIVFPPGATAQVLRIPVYGNTVDERQEQFTLQLLNPVGVNLARAGGVITITDEAPVDLAVSNASVTEGNSGTANAIFTITLRKPLQHTVAVEYFTSDGTARAGADYTATSGTVVFEPGTTEKSALVPVLGDTLTEPNETFFLNLTNAINGVIRVGRGTATIIDDDPRPCLSIGDATVQEGNTGTATAVVPVRLSGPSSETITVEVAVRNCAPSPAQGAAPGLVVFAPGQVERTFAVPVTGDTIHEANVLCAVVLGNPSNATICRGEGVLTVVDDDPLPGIEINDASVVEGNTGTTAVRFTINLAGATTETVAVQYKTVDGTATGGVDYVPASGTLTFAPGVTANTVSIVVNGDLVVEPDESFSVTLSQPVNATLFRGTGQGVIVNDDNAPQADCPKVVGLATPGDQACFEPYAPITLIATPEDAAESVQQVEFYSGSTLLGIDTSSPFQITWEGAPVGDYCITAKANCRSGRSVTSEPFCVGVTDRGAAVAIIRNQPAAEISRLREYLLEMGYCARVFDQAGLNYDALSTYRLVIWDDVGAEGLTDGTVQVLGQLFDAGMPLYLIGDHLVSAGAKLNPTNRSIWANLLHLVPLGRSGVPGVIAFSNSTQDRQPGSILSGRFAEISDFQYDNTVELGRSDGLAPALATGGGGDLFLQSPGPNDSDFGQVRTVTQVFQGASDGTEESVRARKALFQNAICWLLHCNYCPLVYLVLDAAGMPQKVNVGEEFTFNLNVANNGECIANATVVTNRLPAGLALVSFSYNQGVGAEYNPKDRSLVWRVGSVVSGGENNAILTMTVKALQPGSFTYTACGVANYEKFNDSNCTDFGLEIEGTALPDPATLALVPGPLGVYQLKVSGSAGGSYTIQTSPDLLNWTHWTNVLGPLFYLDLPEARVSGKRFYRAR